MTSNEEINDIMKTDKSIEEFSLLIKSNSETIKNGATKKKKKKGRFLGMLLSNNVLVYWEIH